MLSGLKSRLFPTKPRTQVDGRHDPSAQEGRGDPLPAQLSQHGRGDQTVETKGGTLHLSPVTDSCDDSPATEALNPETNDRGDSPETPSRGSCYSLFTGTLKLEDGNLSENSVTEIKETFSLFDQDGDGTITTASLGTVLRALGFCPTITDISNMINEVDPGKTGTFDLPKFLSLCAQYLKDHDTEDGVKAAFKVFDKDGTGDISVVDLKRVLTVMDGSMAEFEVDEMLKEADVRDGRINYEDFAKMMAP